MDQHYGNPVHMAAISMQSQHQQGNQQHYPSHGQYQQLYSDYAESCYPSPGFHDAAFPGDQYGYHSTSSVPYGTGIESYLDPKYAANPSAFASRLPYLPFHAAAVAAYGMYDYSFEPAFIRKRNERERQRVKCVNEGYARLREHLPEEYAEKRLSKVETLRGAIMYIKQLQSILGFDPEKRENKKKNGESTKPATTNKEESSSEKDTDVNKATSDKYNNKTQGQENSGSGPAKKDHERVINSRSVENLSKIRSNTSNDEVKMEDSLSTSPLEDTPDNLCQNIECRSLLSPCSESRYSTTMKTQTSSDRTNHATNRVLTPDNECVLLSPFDCSGFQNDKQFIVERNMCRSQVSRNSVSSTNSDPYSTCPNWYGTRNGSRSNPSFDFGDEYFANNNVNKSCTIRRGMDNDFDAYNAVFRSSRHHPYRKSDWDDVFPVKTETHTPPPYHRQDFIEQNESKYSLFRRSFPKTTQPTYRMNPSSRGAQSDGFKTDTSPESSSGFSP